MQTLDILDRLIGCRTTPDRSNLGLIDFAQSHLAECGFEVERLTDETGRKAGLVARLGPDVPGGVVLSAHSDVVPVDGQDWTRDPFRLSVEAGRAYGRGTTDMKGYLACVLALAGRAARADLHEPLRIVLSYDEEIGCVGIRQMLGRLAPMLGRPRACFVGEPTQMQVAIGHKGKVALDVVCHGQAGHSALAPNFVNALHLAAGLVEALRGLQAELADRGARDPAYAVPYSTVHVGTLRGGAALNIVPDRADLALEIRPLAAERSADLLARIEALAAEVAARFPGGRIEITQRNAYPGLDVAPEDPVVAYARAMAQADGVTKVAFGTEAGYFSTLGIPTVVCGPGSMAGQGHKPDEYVDLSQLAACDAMMNRVLAGLCG